MWTAMKPKVTIQMPNMQYALIFFEKALQLIILKRNEWSKNVSLIPMVTIHTPTLMMIVHRCFCLFVSRAIYVSKSAEMRTRVLLSPASAKIW
jgi:hypothetical protein